MNISEFKATAKEKGLTVKQLVKLSMIQSQTYWNIKYNGMENSPETEISLGDLEYSGVEMRPIKELALKGFINLDGGKCSVTAKGWATECNSGSVIFLGGCDDADVMSQPNEGDPITRFGGK